MIWHRIKHVSTGEEQNVTDHEPYTQSGEWKIMAALDHTPTHHHEWDGKKLVHCPEREAEHRRHVEAEPVSKADLIDMIRALEKRVATLEGAKKK